MSKKWSRLKYLKDETENADFKATAAMNELVEFFDSRNCQKVGYADCYRAFVSHTENVAFAASDVLEAYQALDRYQEKLKKEGK